MNIDLIDESSVKLAARNVDLELAPAHVAGVVMYFKMVATMAATVNAFPLDEECDNAAIFTPCSKLPRE
jgi:hypothetical protein